MTSLTGWLVEPLSSRARTRRAGTADGRREVFSLGEWSVRAVDVRPRRPLEIECVAGELLVTFEGDLDDHIVATGEVFRTSGRGRAVVAAFVPSRVAIRALPVLDGDARRGGRRLP
jgi:hypothetical protein